MADVATDHTSWLCILQVIKVRYSKSKSVYPSCFASLAGTSLPEFNMAILVNESVPIVSLKPVVALPLLAIALALLYGVYIVVYNLFFHPLRNFPGPKLWAIHYGFYACLELSGEGHRRMLKVHEKYGPVVRVAPGHLAFCHPDAIHDLSGHRKPGQLENGKEVNRYIATSGSLASANREDHARMRKSIANGFSQQAMLNQQPLITTYINMLFERFRRFSVDKETFDLGSWLNYATFDIIGDLAFGEPFGCLEESTYHPWVSFLFKCLKSLAVDSAFRRMGILHKVLVMLTPKSLLSKYKEHRELSTQKVHKRLGIHTDRQDFMSSMLARSGKDGLTFDELCANATLLILGGSETTAAAICSATYYLGLNPEPLKKLCDEVRSTFKTEEEIDILSVGHLEYMLAVLNEAIRLHPPGAGTLPRTINERGDTIAGHFVPPGAHIEIWLWTAFHSPDYWTRPEEFIPERWLGDPQFENDKREIFTPFSVGPRGCIAKNLALTEMRLIIARMIWNYDIELAEESIGWDKRCKCYIAFEKGPLYVRLKPRE
ncbi:cytochrome P450 [Trichoderma austrokoningii]